VNKLKNAITIETEYTKEFVETLLALYVRGELVGVVDRDIEEVQDIFNIFDEDRAFELPAALGSPVYGYTIVWKCPYNEKDQCRGKNFRSGGLFSLEESEDCYRRGICPHIETKPVPLSVKREPNEGRCMGQYFAQVWEAPFHLDMLTPVDKNAEIPEYELDWRLSFNEEEMNARARKYVESNDWNKEQLRRGLV
jgi:hypothetical protein